MTRRPGAIPAFSWLLIYAVAAVVVAALWTERAKSEKQSNNWGSIVAIADGSTRLPFVKRRLLADAANLLARAVPGNVWTGVSNVIDGKGRLKGVIRDRLGWRREHDPVLISATALIGLSAFGFMVVMRSMIVSLYSTTDHLADLAGLLMGLALLGGGGDIRFGWFPYDLPHAFVFGLGLSLLLKRSPWLIPVFALAAYSKETAILLIPAYLLVYRDRIDARFFIEAIAMGATFLLVRHAIDLRYGPGSSGFWFPGRNARLVASWLAFDSWWYAPFVLVAVVRISRVWREFPISLRRLVVLAIVPLGIAVFKGWIEEKRQYLELLPILGPLILQWVAIELGLGQSVRARQPA